MKRLPVCELTWLCFANEVVTCIGNCPKNLGMELEATILFNLRGVLRPVLYVTDRFAIETANVYLNRIDQEELWFKNWN